MVEVETTNYSVFEGEINDGEYLAPKVFFENIDEIGDEMAAQTTFPHELAQLVEQGKATKQDLQDASGWDLDDAEIKIIKTK